MCYTKILNFNNYALFRSYCTVIPTEDTYYFSVFVLSALLIWLHYELMILSMG